MTAAEYVSIFAGVVALVTLLRRRYQRRGQARRGEEDLQTCRHCHTTVIRSARLQHAALCRLRIE